MALQIFNSDTIGTGLQVSLGTDDDLYVAAGVVIASTNGGMCIQSLGAGQIVHVEGQVATNGMAISLGIENTTANAETYLGVDSIVRSYGYAAVGLFGGGHTIELHGKVFADLYGVQLAQGTGVESFITNDGIISALDTGILVDSTDTVTIENSGKIEGDGAGIWIQGTSGGIRIVNSGTIKGDSGIINISTSAMIIENSGLIRLGAQLGSGDDIYDGRLGRITGDLLAGSGDDTVRGGTSDERFQGQAGSDLLSGGLGGDIFIYTDAGDSTMDASGRDLITDFSRKSDDFIDFSDLISGELDFVGKSHFSGADEVRYQVTGKYTFVYVNLDADQEAEMAIQCVGKIKFVQNDFAL